jgi:hypothetical protein
MSCPLGPAGCVRMVFPFQYSVHLLGHFEGSLANCDMDGVMHVSLLAQFYPVVERGGKHTRVCHWTCWSIPALCTVPEGSSASYLHLP